MSAPQLRFRAESGKNFPSWSTEKLNALAKIYDGTHMTPEYKISGVPFFSVEHLTSNNFKDTKFISEEVFEKENIKVKLEKGDILMTKIGDIGTAKYIDWDVRASFYVSLALIKQSSAVNSLFLARSIASPYFQKELHQRIIHVAFPKKINLGEIGECLVQLPCEQEQTKIANFLTAVDEKITQLTQKHDLLTQYKKGVMQQIFSQELRFKDNDGQDFPEWEKKTLGEIGVFQTSSIDKLSKENETEVFLVNYMNVYRHENLNGESIKSFQVVTAKSSQIESCNLKKGDILFTPSSETPDDIGHSVVIFEDLKNAVFSYHLMRFRPKQKIDILYSHYFCNIPSVLSQLTKLATGSTRFTISVKSFSSIALALPCLAEQTKIAHFLKAIDEKITAIQTQLQAVKQYKQGLLQQMFV